MTMDEEFSTAQARVKQLSKTPASDELLELYAYYKQGTVGDASGARPGMLDFKGRAKFDAWNGRRGMPAETAKKAYIEFVQRLVAKYG